MKLNGLLYDSAALLQYPFDRRLRDPRARMDTVEMRKDVCPAGNRTRFFGRSVPAPYWRRVNPLFSRNKKIKKQDRMKCPLWRVDGLSAMLICQAHHIQLSTSYERQTADCSIHISYEITLDHNENLNVYVEENGDRMMAICKGLELDAVSLVFSVLYSFL
jgi:hypothetical protein